MDNEELEGVKFSEFPSQTPVNADEVVGLHSGDNARFSIANIVAAVRQGLASIFVPLTRTINGKGLSTDISLDSSDIDYDNTQSGLTADNVQDALDELAQGGGGGGGSAVNVTYDPTTSGASATNVQDALDEAFGDLDDKQSTITANGILKGDGAGGVSTATAGTDYQAPLTAGTDYATPAQLEGKANQAQLAYVETGTTASRNYTAGQYISLNGLLYTADTAIASGATFYTSGGNKNLTECVGGGFNDVQSFNVSPASGVTINSQSNYKIGNLVFLYSEFKITSDLPAWSPVYTLPFPAFFGSFYLEASGAMPVSQVLYSSNNYTISKGRNALPAGTYLVSVMGCITR